MVRSALRHHFTPLNVLACIAMALISITLAVIIGTPKAFNYRDGWDFFTFWNGAHLLVRGESPYDTTAWLNEHSVNQFPPQNQGFVYPLPLAILLLPIGLLPLYTAAIVWAALTILALFISVGLVLWGRVKWRASYLIPVLAGVFLFRPVAVNIYILQLDGLVLLWVAAAFILFQRHQWFWSGMVLALTVLKPQVGVPLLAFLGTWQLLRHQWRALAGEALGGGVLLALGLLVDPQWVQRWLAIGSHKTAVNFYSTPTLWGLTSLVCKPNLACVQWLGAALTVITCLAVILVLWRLKEQDVAFIMALAICVTLFISPYLWTYSQLLLVIPILMVTVALYRMQKPYLLTASFPLIMALFSFGLVGIAMLVGADLVSGLLPVAVAALLIWVYHKDARLLRLVSEPC